VTAAAPNTLMWTALLVLFVSMGPAADFKYPQTPSWTNARQSGRTAHDSCNTWKTRIKMSRTKMSAHDSCKLIQTALEKAMDYNLD
jgi:hypothetical protein